jgi:hypothetical protein
MQARVGGGNRPVEVPIQQARAVQDGAYRAGRGDPVEFHGLVLGNDQIVDMVPPGASGLPEPPRDR